MKSLVYILLFLIAFTASFYFFMLNADQSVSLTLFGDWRTPSLPIGMVVLIAFFAGFIAGVFFLPLTYIIKRLS